MIQDARFGCFAALLVAALGSGAAFAQTAAGQGGWVDPPVRGAAPPPAAETQKPAAEAPTSEKSADAAARPETRVAASKPAPRAAGLRRARIRAAATRSRVQTVSRQRPVQVRLGRLGGQRRERVAARAYRAPAAPYAYRAERWGQASLKPLPPYRHRRDGWTYLTSESRAERIERARNAGYLVMRSRSYTYPDGTRVISLTPFGEPYLD